MFGLFVSSQVFLLRYAFAAAVNIAIISSVLMPGLLVLPEGLRVRVLRSTFIAGEHLFNVSLRMGAIHLIVRKYT